MFALWQVAIIRLTRQIAILSILDFNLAYITGVIIMHHMFNVKLAVDYSEKISIFLSNLAFWTIQNLANEKHIYDGHCWVYNSVQAFMKLFPYWTKKQCENIITAAVSEGLLIKGNYNHSKYDRTIWYALTPKSMAYFDEFLDENLIEPLSDMIYPNGEMDFSKRENGFIRKGEPIPDINTDNKQNTILCIDQKSSKPDSGVFEKFWNLYPVKKGKKKCLAIWKSRGLESKAEIILEKLQEQIRADDEWLQGFAPHPSTYLNQDRWEDEIVLPKDEIARRHKAEAKKLADDLQRERFKAQEQRAETRRVNHVKSSPPKDFKSLLMGKLSETGLTSTPETENLGSNLTYGKRSTEIGT